MIKFVDRNLECEDRFDDLLSSSLFKESKFILLSFNWGHKLPPGKMLFSVNQIPSVTKFMKENGKKLILFKKRTEFYNIPALLMKYNNFALVNINSSSDNYDVMNKNKSNLKESIKKNIGLEEYVFINRPYKNNTKKINSKIMKYSTNFKIPLIGLDEYQCDEINKKCIVKDNNGNLLYIDHGHLTINGSIHFGNYIEKNLLPLLR